MVFGQLGQPVGQFLGGGHSPLSDDMRRNSVFPAQGAYPGRSAYRVVVRGPVPHNKHLGRVGNQRRQGVCHHPALHLGALLRLLGAAPIELKGKLVADDRLVPPSGQGHVDGQIGKVQQLAVAVSILTDTDGEGGIDPAWVGNLMNAV